MRPRPRFLNKPSLLVTGRERDAATHCLRRVHDVTRRATQGLQTRGVAETESERRGDEQRPYNRRARYSVDGSSPATLEYTSNVSSSTTGTITRYTETQPKRRRSHTDKRHAPSSSCNHNTSASTVVPSVLRPSSLERTSV